MGVFQRIRLILNSNINHMISKAENPEKILEQLIIEMRKQLQEAKKEVAVVVAEEKRLERQLQNEKKEAADWEKKAMFAVRSGRDELARQALARKTEHDGRVAEYQQQWESLHSQVEALRGSLRALSEKIEEARRKKNLLIARHKRAKAQQKIHDTMSGLSDTSAFDAFDRMQAKVDTVEAEAAASAELSTELGFGGDALEAEFKELRRDSGDDGALLALKAKMGMAPGSEGGGPSDVDDLEAQLQAMKDRAE